MVRLVMFLFVSKLAFFPFILRSLSGPREIYVWLSAKNRGTGGARARARDKRVVDSSIRFSRRALHPLLKLSRDTVYNWKLVEAKEERFISPERIINCFVVVLAAHCTLSI